MRNHPPERTGEFTITEMEPLTNLQTSVYLDRLDIPEKDISVPDLAFLNRLIAVHVKRFKFHGVDAFLGRSPSLETDDIFRKVVERDRGGYCFELNTLFARLLTKLGYRLQLRPARVRWRFPTDDKIPLPVTHVLICVELGEPEDGRQYFVDVGFGSVANPFRAIPVSEVFRETEPYRVRLLDSSSGTMELALLDRRPGATEGRWRCLYDVDRHPVEIVDLVPLNWYGGTHPDSVFRRALIAGRWAGNFWVTLRNNCMIRRWPSGEAEESRTIGSADEVVEFLEKEFGLSLDHDTEVEPLRSRLEEVIRAEAQG